MCVYVCVCVCVYVCVWGGVDGHPVNRVEITETIATCLLACVLTTGTFWVFCKSVLYTGAGTRDRPCRIQVEEQGGHRECTQL